MSAFIIGSGAFLPESVITNEAIAARLGLEPEQIFKSSGIRRRHWARAGTTTSSLATEALRLALDDAKVNPNQIDYLVFGTMTPDRLIPGSAPSVQHKLGLEEIPCLDIRAACCNALYALQLARALIDSSTAATVAICLADVQSPFLDLSPASATLSMLFGDGASALIVSSEKQSAAIEIIDILLASNGKYTDDLGVRRPGSEFGPANDKSSGYAADFAPHMNGQSVILQASRRMIAGCQALLERNKLTAIDLGWIVPHQANANLLAQVARGLGVSTDKTQVISILEDSGNTSSASMGIALDTLRRSGRLRVGDRLLMPAFAAGFTWGAALCESATI